LLSNKYTFNVKHMFENFFPSFTISIPYVSIAHLELLLLLLFVLFVIVMVFLSVVVIISIISIKISISIVHIWPWILVVWISTADINSVASLVETWNEWNSPLFLNSIQSDLIVNHDTIEITINFWNTFHCTWTLDEGLLIC